jgi:hypothetical protein
MILSGIRKLKSITLKEKEYKKITAFSHEVIKGLENLERNFEIPDEIKFQLMELKHIANQVLHYLNKPLSLSTEQVKNEKEDVKREGSLKFYEEYGWVW